MRNMWTGNKMTSDTFKVYGIRYDMSQVNIFTNIILHVHALKIISKSHTLDKQRSHLTSNTWEITVNTAF